MTMATSTIKRGVHFGTRTQINATAGYTAETDGVLEVYMNPTNSSPAYGLIDGIPNGRINTFSGYATTQHYPVTKGSIIKLGSSSGNANFSFYFLPIE